MVGGGVAAVKRRAHQRPKDWNADTADAVQMTRDQEKYL